MSGLLVLLAALTAQAVFAATFVVSNTNDVGTGSLREAMTAAAASQGPHVVDATGVNGTISLATVLPQVNTAVTISGPGAASLTISRTGGGSGTSVNGTAITVASGGALVVNGVRFFHAVHLGWNVLHVQAGAEATLTHCVLERTGGIENWGNLAIEDCEFLANSNATHGAILQQGGGQLDCLRTSFVGNAVFAAQQSATASAGVLEMRGGSARVYECLLEDNQAGNGAGGIRSLGKLDARDTVFRSNTTSISSSCPGGGAVRVEFPGSETTFWRCFFDENSSWDGGAIAMGTTSVAVPSGVDIYACCFKGNFVERHGGAIYIAASTGRVYNTTFSGNSAGARGGAIHVVLGAAAQSTVPYLFHCTIVHNTAATQGGGCTVVNVANCVVALNTAPVYPDLEWVLAPQYSHNFIGAYPVNWTYQTPHQNMVGTLANPLNPMLGPLQLNGGPTPTHMPLPGSPLIDGGSRVTWPNFGSWHVRQQHLLDQNGTCRAVDMPELSNYWCGDGCDIGAVEVQRPWRLAPIVCGYTMRTTAVNAPSLPAHAQISAEGVQAPLALSVTSPFEIASSAAGPFGSSLLTAAPDASGSIALTPFVIRYAPTWGAVHMGTLEISSVGAGVQVVPLRGSVNAGAASWLHAGDEPLILSWGDGLPTPPQTTHIEGAGLAAPISLSVPAPFQISLTPAGPWVTGAIVPAPTDGYLPQTAVWVRMVTSVPGTYVATLTVSSQGIPNATRPLQGYLPIPSGAIYVGIRYQRNGPPFEGGSFYVMDFESPGVGVPAPAKGMVVWGLAAVTAPITVQVQPPFEVSLAANTGYGPSVDVGPAETVVHIRYHPTAGTDHTGIVYMSSPGVVPRFFHVMGQVTPQSEISTSVDSLAFPSANTVLSYTLSGSGLIGPVVVSAMLYPGGVSLNPAGPFDRTLATATPVGGVLPPTTIYAAYQGGTTVPGNNLAGFIDHYNGPANLKRVRLLGCTSESIQATVLRMGLASADGLPSTPHPYTVWGHNLTAPIMIAAPAGFVVSLDQSGPFTASAITAAPVGGLLPPTTVFVRYLPVGVGPHSGDLTHTSGGAPPRLVALTGAVKTGPIVQPAVLDLQFQKVGLGAPTAAQSYTLRGVNLSGPITILAPVGFEVALSLAGTFGASAVTPAPVQGSVTATVYARYSPASGVRHVGALTHRADGAEDSFVTLRGRVLGPTVQVSVASLVFGTSGLGVPSAPQSYTVSGGDLQAPVTITAPVGFEVSFSATSGFGPSVITPAPVNFVLAPVTVFTRYNPAAGMNHAGDLVHASAGATDALLAVSGVVVIPTIQVGATSLVMIAPAPGVPSPPQTYLVQGSGLLGVVNISVSGNFEVSLSPTSGFAGAVITPAPVGGTLPPTDVYVRYNPASGMQHNGTAAHGSGGATTVFVSLTGSVTPVPVISAASGGLVFVSPVAGVASPEQSYTVSGVDLTGPVTIDAPAPFEVGLASGGPYGAQVQSVQPAGGVVSPFTVFARYNPASGTAHAGGLVHSSPGAMPVVVSMQGGVSPPQLNVGTAGIAFGDVAVGAQSAGQSYRISGSSLAGTVVVSAGPPFEVSLAAGGPFGAQVVSPAPVLGVLAPTEIYVRFVPVASGAVVRSLDHQAPGMAIVSVPLSGTGVVIVPPAPLIVVAAAALEFESVAGAPSPEQSYSVQGSVLAGPITVTAPQGFEVSLTSGTGFGALAVTPPPVSGVVPPTSIYVRYNPQTGVNHGGHIAHTCVGAAAKYASVQGRVITSPASAPRAEPGCTAAPGACWPLIVLFALRRYRRTIHSAMLK